MPTLRLRKLLASLFVFASLCVGAQAATYWWTGGAAGNWSDPENWSTGSDIASLTAQAAGAPVPGDDPADIVNLISAANITVSSDVQIDQLLIPNPNLENSDFTITLTGSGSINAATKIDPVRAAGPSAGSTAKSTFVFDCDVSSAELIMHSGGDVTIAEGTKATITTISNPGGDSPSTMLTVNGTLISNSISLSATTTRQMTVGPNAIVTAGTLTGSSNSVTNNGLIVSNGDISSVIKEESTGSTAETGGATGFVWTGASSNDWSTASNWLNGTAPTSASNNISIPNVTTKPLITSGDTVAITASKLTIVNGADITVNGTLNITGDFALDSKIKSSSSGTIAVNGKLTNSAAAFSAANLTLSSTTLDASKNLSCKSLSVSGESSISGTSTITSTGSSLSDGLTFGDKITQTSGSLSLISNGTVSLAGADVTTISIQAPSTISGAINATNISIQDSATINAAINASGAFSANTNMGGKTITLAANVTAGSIALAGNSTVARLTLAGSGTLSTTNFTGSNLSIGADIVLDDYTITTPLTGCVPSAGTSASDYWTVLQKHWLIQDLSNYEFVWQGDDATSPNNWNVAENWNTGYVPVTDCKITIPSGNPVIPDTGTFAGGTLSIASGASVKLGTRELNLSGTENGSPATILTNIGTIIYTGNGRITNSGTPINDTAHGTVEYASGGTPGTVTDFTADTDSDDYCNLVISGTGWTLAGTLKMQTITIANDAKCTVNSATTLRAQTFNFKGDSTHKNIAASANLTLLPYVATDDLTVPSGIDSKFSISPAGWLHLGDASTNSIIYSSSDSFNYFEYKQYFHAAVELQQDITVRNTVTADADIGGTGTLIFAGTGNVIFNAGTNTYASIKIDKDDGTNSKLTINGNCNISALELTKSPLTTIADSPTVTTYSDSATSGNLIFSSGATFTNSFIRNSGGTTQITGTITASSVTLKNTTISGAAAITTTGTQNFTGTINGATGSTDELTLEASSVTFNDNVGETTNLTKLTVNAPLIIAETDKSISASEIDFQGAISGAGKTLTVNTPLFKSTATTDNTITLSELTFVANSTSIDTSSKKLTFTVSAINGAEKTLALSSGSEAEFAAGIIVFPTVSNDGTITCSGGATFKGAYSGTGATLTLSNTTTVFESNLDLSGTTFAHSNGTVQIGGIATSTVTVKGPQTFNNFETTRSLKILGANSFHDFTATSMGGKSISFEAGKNQTVSGTLSLSGTSTSSLLTLQNEGTGGSGVWTITCSNPSISYVNVINSTSTNSIFALNSNDAGNNTNWNFPGQTYTWTGATNTDWNTASNWNPTSIPGKGTIVTIEATTNHPILTEDLNLNQTYNSISYSGEITVAANATFDLQEYILTVGSITNNGTVRLKGVANQISGSISNGTAVSTVEYYDDSTTLGPTTLAWGNTYKKFIINKPANLDDIALSVSDTTIISAGTGKSVSLNNSSNEFEGHVTIGNSAATPTVNAGSVILKGTGTSGTAIYLEDNILADSLTLNSNVRGGDLSITGLVTVNTESISTTGNQTYKNAVTVSANTTFSAASGKLIKFEDTITGSGTPLPAVTIQTANSQFDGTISSLSSLTTAAANINCNSISTSGNQTYGGPAILGANLSLTSTSGGNILFDSTVNGAYTLTLNQASSTTFNGIVQLTGFADSTSHTGSVTFKANTTIFNATSFNTSQTVTFGDSDTDTFTFNSNLSHAAGNTSIRGNLSAANINLGTTYAQGTITTSGSQSYIGTLELNDDLSLSSTATGAAGITFSSTINGTHNLIISTNSGTNGTVFNGTVGTTSALAALSVTGPSAINSASITSTGNQTYDGPLSIQANTTLRANAGQLIYLKNTVTGSGTPLPAVTIQTANSQFDGIISSLSSLTTAASTSFNANIISLGTLSTATANINCNSISTSGNQTYDGPAILGTNLNLTSGANILFNSILTGTYTLTLTQAASTTFNGAVQLTGFADAITHTGSVTFNAGGTISNATSFNTPQTVTFGNEASDTITFGSSPDYVNLTHTSGATVINGRLIAADITLADTSGGPITITTPGLFLLADGKSLSYTSSFTQNGNGNSVLRGNFGSASGNGSATFAHSVQLNASGTASFGTTGDSISITDNLIITGPSAGVAINASTSVNKNIVMYSGAVTLGANLSAQKDILILGTSYSETDTSTNITDEYAYTASRPAGWSTGNYNTTQLPDRTSLPATSTYSATLETQAGVTVTAGKNFYANGTTLSLGSGSGQWNLELPDLTNPANGFAEAYFTKITDCKVICNDNSDDGSKAKLISLEDTDSDTEKSTCTNVDFDDFKITSAYTVRDNVICVVFNRPVRYHSTIINSLKFSNSSANPECSFTGLYSDPDCQNELNYDTQMSYFYIKAAPQNSASTGAWNTDATGKYSGNPKSSDRFGFHHDTFPCLDFPRSLPSTASAPTISFLITDRWGKRLNNYSRRVPKAAAAEAAYGSAASTHVVEDKTGPVLWTVRTGQELHTAYDSTTGEASQHAYDSHNFLEFRYSEPVDVGSITAYNPPADPSKNPNVIENIQVTDSLGAISENITYASNSLTFAGLARITGSSLRLYTGSNGAANKYVNALYRTDEYSVRLSVAGWTDGTITDYSGNSYKKWPGYIEAASQFTGARAHTVAATNNLVKDQAGNYQIEYAANKAEPLIISNASDENSSALLPVSPDLYSSWDISSPVFAPLRFSKETEWGNQDMAEAIGNTNGSGSTLDRIDFHFFDNTPSFTNSDEAEWYTEIGWCSPGSEASKDNLKDSSYTYCADIVGGARQFDSNSTRRTTGGIRFSTKAKITPAFRYSTSPANMSPDTEFQDGINNIFTTIVSQLFTGSSSPMRPANDPDGLYLGLGLSDTNLSVETTFSFSYNESLGYLTDLAGNRLRSKVLKTIDRTPPSFDIILSPVDNNEVFIIFVKQIITDSSKLRLTRNSGQKVQIDEDFYSLIPRCFRLISIDENGNIVEYEENQIDTSISAQPIEKVTNKSFTGFKLTLKKNINIEEIKNLYIQLIMPEPYPTESKDPFTNNINSRVTFIQDSLGNYMGMYNAHALSDFAINYVNPLYAYSSDMLDNGESVMKGLYEEGSWAVHDWNADQKNYGTLPANHPISIVADTKGNEKIRVYLTPAPDEESVSTQFNSDFETKLRVWLPDLTDGIFRALSAANNTNYAHFDGSLLDKNSGNSIFNIDEKTVSSWASGNQISFTFGLMEDEENPVRIYNNPYYDIETGKFNFALSTSVPLFSLRMTDKSNIESLDLWSFKLKGITTQRGGVTILNNVINASKGENTVVMVELPEDGRLNVCVMTLDGNIITYLNRGKTTAGEHYFTWNGKNRNGASVARGMYFVRVTGAGIDETRKVMVVKD